MSTPEGLAKAKIKVFLKSLDDCWFFMPIGGPYSVQGIPDIVGCISGGFFAIEVKAPGREGNTTELQKIQIAGITEAGGIAFVASNVETVRMAFMEWGIHVP